MAGTAVTFLSVTLAHVILRLRVAREIIGFLSVTDTVHTYIHKWKKHFSEMKGDVGMSLHEKEGEQEDAYTKTGSH